jgi:hypothetical protein
MRCGVDGQHEYLGYLGARPIPRVRFESFLSLSSSERQELVERRLRRA